MQGMALRKLLARAGGARLCYGKPVKAGDRTVIPVARVFSAGGFGYGAGGDTPDNSGEGGGGGGVLDARPIGFIEVGKGGSRFHKIPDPDRPIRLLKAVTGVVAVLASTTAGRRAATAARDRVNGWRPRLLRRGG
jgi:uncharacterized spore protein YtfJ